MNTIASPRATEPLRLEHRELLPEIEALGLAADAVGTASEAQIRGLMAKAHDFLANHLVPHATAEDAVLYPAVEEAMHAPGATDTMRRDHVQAIRDIEALGRETEDTAPIDGARRLRIQRLLYGLHAVVSLHFAKEEEIYLEVLDRSLTPDAAEALFERMEAVATTAR